MLAKIASDDATATITSTTSSWSAALPMSAAEASTAGTATADSNNNDTDKDDVDSMTPIVASRPSTSREHSTDSGFDERSSLSKPKRYISNGTAVVLADIQSEPDAISPHDKTSSTPSPSIAQRQPLQLPLPLAMPTSRSNSISLPIHSQEPSVRPSARSTSLGHLLSLSPLSPLPLAIANRPRALSIAATAISSTSTGAQLSVSMSASADKSRLDIRHNSLAISTEPHHSSSLLPGETRLDREWDDPSFSYLAPIAANLLTCQGEHFFDLVVEELSVNLGVKYAFISQLVSLEELKELDPTEYMNLIEQFGGLVPPLDGVMHNISSWPGESHINPHAFQGYLADCTIQDKVTFIDSNLADQHQDVAECLMDHTIESYVGMRLETVQGEIVGVIGIIHDRALTEEDSLIVRLVLEQVGIRVANELDRLKIESNLIYARDVAESTAKNKTKFLADMSHEIRNPMNAVVGVTDILLDTAGLSDEQTGYIEVIRTSGQHLLTVINDILDISRIDQDVKFLLERRPLSLRKCLKDAVSLAGLTPLHDVSRSISVIEWPPEMDDLGPFSELEETNILPLLWSIDHDVPEHLLGDITRLRQVLINLCTNSLKFTQRGRVSVHVAIHQPSAQYPTIRPNSTPMVTRNTPQSGQAYSPRTDGGPSSSSSPSSPMLTGSDHRTQMVFQQRYDVKTDSSQSTYTKPSPASSRRRQADKRYLPLPSPNTQPDQSSTFAPPSLTVVAPTANSLESDKMDENTVILEFAVSDTGVGIPANKITELFTSFSQVDISVSTRFGGTGLGLAISASLVEKMGGNIWVESTEGVGRTPPSSVATSPTELSKPTVPTYAKVVESTMRPLTIDGVPLRILLAEDNAVNQKIAVGVLRKLGYENVDVAENGLEVIQRLDEGSIYDVILMDVSMPVMDGIDATKTIVDRRLRGLLSNAAEISSCEILAPEEPQSNGTHSSQESSPERVYKDYKNLYVIALTASAMGSDKERCMEAGMDDFMTKPFALLEMKRALNDYIHKWDGGALQVRNETCVSAALAAVKSRCNTPNSSSDRALTPTIGKSPSLYSSTVSLADHDSTDSLCSLGCANGTDTQCGDGYHTGSSGANGSSPPSSMGRSRIETPRPLRRNLDAIGCSLFSAGRRSHSEAVLNGLLGPVAMEGGLLASRRASDVFSLAKREWRSGLGLSNDNLNGVQDVHPLDPLIDGAQVERDRENGMTSPSNSSLAPLPSHGANGFSHPHLRVKRVMSPSSLSKEQDFGGSFKPTASPLSPLSLLTTDTEGSSSVSPPLSSTSSASPTETTARRPSSGDETLFPGPHEDPRFLSVSVPVKDKPKSESEDSKAQAANGDVNGVKEVKEVKEVKDKQQQQEPANGQCRPAPSRTV
ncbi:hypothetical protein KI688_011332 [Linnemannia hyalina]|uniref:Uncharacterized protein n=1 Tax=Linnemannia hyalina TaxID=64524 RepID=A0A9P7XUX6_9FUNG|nr:hypothetical protein KI688_011332 [Linnemannia hyalina]